MLYRWQKEVGEFFGAWQNSPIEQPLRRTLIQDFFAKQVVITR
jgi:hypothetical protein